MKISEVNIKNFRGIGERDFKVKLNDSADILLLVGPNGYGKTTFFDAVEWAFTGRVNRIEELKDVDRERFNMGKFINYQDKENTNKKRIAQVDLVLSDGSIISRTNNKTSRQEVGDYGKNAIEYIKMGKKYTDQYSLENEFIKSDFRNNIIFEEQFYYSHILGQDTINSFVHNYKGVTRQKKIFEMIGMKNFQVLSEMLDAERGYYKKFNKKLEEKRKSYTTIQSELDVLKNILDQYLQKVNLDGVDNLRNNFRLKLKDIIDSVKETSGDFINESVENSFLNVNFEDFGNIKIELETIKFKLESKVTELKNKKSVTRNFYINEKIIEALKALMEERSKSEKLDYLIKHYATSSKCIRINYEERKELVYSSTEKVLDNLSKLIEKVSRFVCKIEKKDLVYLRLYTFLVRRISFNSKNLAFMAMHTSLLEAQSRYKNALPFYLTAKDEYEKFNSLICTQSQVQENYKKLLVIAKEYISDNTDKIDKEGNCPICHQSLVPIIKQDGTPTENLLEIINETLLLGDNNLEILQKELDLRKTKLNQMESTINNEKYLIDSLFVKFKEVLTSEKHRIEKKVERIVSKVNKKEVENQKLYHKEREKNNKINGVISELLSEIQEEQISSFSNDLYKLALAKIEQLLSTLESHGLSIIELSENRKIKGEIERLEAENNTLSENNEDTIIMYKLIKANGNDILPDFNIQIKKYEQTCQEIEKIIMEFFPEYLKNDLFDIVNKQKELIKIKEAKEIIESDALRLKELCENVSIKTEEIIKNYIEKNGLICSIYEAINPHPFYRELRLQQRNGGIEMMCEGTGDRLFLDYIFSSAQNNVLALSIFLGFALQQKWSCLEQIFIDDPIQNMDDINVLSFIDILRGLYLSKNFKKQIIISTHDFKLAELFRKKLRFLNLEIVRFESYTNEGPILRFYDKNLQELEH